MRILRESADELVIFSPARATTIVTAIGLAVGFLVGFSIGVYLLVVAVVGFFGPAVGGLGVADVPVIPRSAPLFAVGGRPGRLAGAGDTEYHFLASQRKLIVRQANRERRVVPFSEIVEAVVYTNCSSHEYGPDTYGLRLKRRGFLRNLRVSQVDRSDDDWRSQMEQLAVRINRFLEVCPSEPLERLTLASRTLPIIHEGQRVAGAGTPTPVHPQQDRRQSDREAREVTPT